MKYDIKDFGPIKSLSTNQPVKFIEMHGHIFLYKTEFTPVITKEEN